MTGRHAAGGRRRDPAEGPGGLLINHLGATKFTTRMLQYYFNGPIV